MIRVCGPAILLLDDLRLHLPLPLALLFFLLNFFLFGHGKLSLQLILGRVVVVHVPGLRIPSGERGVALATDEAVDGAPLQVPRLAPWIPVTLLFLVELLIHSIETITHLHLSLWLLGYTGAIRTWWSDSRTKATTGCWLLKLKGGTCGGRCLRRLRHLPVGVYLLLLIYISYYISVFPLFIFLIHAYMIGVLGFWGTTARCAAGRHPRPSAAASRGSPSRRTPR